MRGYPARGRHVRWRVRSFEQGSIGVWARSLVRAVGNDEAMTCGPTVSVVPVPPCVARAFQKKELRSEAARGSTAELATPVYPRPTPSGSTKNQATRTPLWSHARMC